MTREEAYNAMQEGLPVSHKDFAPDEFLYMNENYVIHDENGDEFEAAWDVQESQERFKTGWYIFKNKKKIITKKRIDFVRPEQYRIEEKQYISHTPNAKCPGKDICLQYSLVGETACIICDVNFDDNEVLSHQFTPGKLLKGYIEDNPENKEQLKEDIENEKRNKSRRNNSAFRRFCKKLFRKRQ